MKFKHLLFFTLLFSGSIIAIYPQEEQPEDAAVETTPEVIEETTEEIVTAVPEFVEDENTVYVIREINFDIDGRTRPFALLMNSDLVIGEYIIGKTNFDKYLSKQRQTLNNQRVLDEVKIEYFPGEIEEDGALAINLLVHVKDSWNFVIVPYPKYDSNSGWSITLKARDYNFFGTMNTLFFDFGYQYDNSNDHIFNIAFGTEFPFQALGLDWSVRLDNTFIYTVGDPLYYMGIAGLSVKLPWRTTTFTVGFNQYLVADEDNSAENKKVYGLGDIFEGVYGATELYASWRIPINLEVGPFGKLYYTPRISERINYPYSEMDESRKPLTRLSHSLGFGRINWEGNYRKGLNASISNAFNIYADRSDAPFDITLNGEAIFHWPFNKYIGISSRLKYRQWWHWSDTRSSLPPTNGYGDGWMPNHSAGDVLRGIIDDDIWANYMLSLNIDLPIRVLRFWPSDWFNNNKLRLFNFEMHIVPFLDLALIEGPYNKLVTPHNDGIRFRLDDMLVTTGLEVIVFPAFFRSIYIRASIGYDLKKIAKDGLPLKWGFFPEWNEIFIGLDHYY